MKDKIENMGFLKGVILLFIVGFLLGIGIFMGLREYISEYVYVFFDNILENLAYYEIEQGKLLRQIIKTEFRSFFLLILFGVSMLSVPALLLFPAYKGFVSGFLLASLLVKFSGKGLLIGIIYGFPQMIFYIPVMVAVLHKNYYIGMQGLKKKLFLEQLPSIAILAVILLIGCYSEAYINSWIMKIILL